jgi:acyl-lipid omega-6 desaturase (Delta-12 desaturase)
VTSTVSKEPTSALQWAGKLSRFQTPRAGRAMAELAITAVPFVACWYGMYWGFAHQNMLVYALLLLPAVGFLARLFLIQHDCGHYAFLASRSANDWTGRVISVVTLTPYGHWRRAHAIHHATSGNLDRRGVGDIDTLTVDEYNARTPWSRLLYRIYRSPFVMFGIGPVFVFVLQNRIPAGFFRTRRAWVSVMMTNLALAALVTVLVQAIGMRAFLMVHAPIVLLSASIGGWLFYVQHQFPATSWDESKSWSVREAAFRGSSHYDLPVVLRWFSANIGIHHVHHLCSRIPFYRLPSVLRAYPELKLVGRLTLLESLRCVHLVLWNPQQRKLVSFRDATAQQTRRDTGLQTIAAE